MPTVPALGPVQRATTTRRRLPAPARRVVPPLIAGLAALSLGTGLSGCYLWAPDTVLEAYAPADGLNAELPDVWVRNLVVVGEDTEGRAVLSGVLYNRTADPVEVVVRVPSAEVEQTIGIPAEGRVTLNAGTEPADGEAAVVEVEPAGQPPGATLPVEIVTPAFGTLVLQPPIVLPQGAYQDFLTPPAE